jgi:hypothetical protein
MATKPPINADPEVISQTLRDPEFQLHFIENNIAIADKGRNVVPFIFNPVQRHFHLNMGHRNLVLKGSQMGFTSGIMARNLVNTILVPNTTSVIIAHEEFITQRLLAKAKFFEASIPDQYKPTMHHRSSYEMTWDDIGSTFYIGSARSYVFGRGERIDNAHMSEFAFWPDPEKIFDPMSERVPMEGCIVIESTPNGEGNKFHQLWLEAREGEKNGQSVWKAFFYPWWLDSSYRIPRGSEFALAADIADITYTPDEERLIRLHHLDEEQIRWRRRKIHERKGIFWQEYPEDEVTCFLPVSDMVFDRKLLEELAKGAYPAPYSFENAQVWHLPEERGIYVIGADPTVGYGDKAAAVVWDVLNMQYCARLTGLLVPNVFAEKLASLGHYYKDATLVVEANNPGGPVLTALIDIHRYPNIFYWRDLATGKATNKPGWWTTDRSKHYMVDEFRKLLPQVKCCDIDFIREIRNMRYFGTNVDSIAEDDIAMAGMIGIAAKGTSPIVKGFVGAAGWHTW